MIKGPGMETLKTLDEIKTYWTNASKTPVDDNGLRPTARDPHLQEAVEDAIEPWLFGNAKLLDVGSGDGLSTLRFAERTLEAVGVDYIGDYVAMAKKAAAESGRSNVRFSEGSVLDLSPIRKEYGQFDIVTTIRCLINLATWENQAIAIREIATSLKPGGLYLTSEGWEEGMAGLNIRRQRQGQAPISVVGYNLMLKRSQFEQEAAKYFELVGYASLGLYLFLSRVMQPILTAPQPPSHLHPLNRVAREVQKCQAGYSDFLDCDYAGVYIFRKK